MCNVCIDVCFDVMCCLNDMDCHVVCLGTMFSSYFIFFFRLIMEEKNNIGGTLCSSANLLTIPIIEATQDFFMSHDVSNTLHARKMYPPNIYVSSQTSLGKRHNCWEGKFFLREACSTPCNCIH